MKRITIRHTDGTETVYATNDSGEGCFTRKPYEGAYRQTAGTSQTPIFRTRQQFRKWLGKLDGKIIEHSGW